MSKTYGSKDRQLAKLRRALAAQKVAGKGAYRGFSRPVYGRGDYKPRGFSRRVARPRVNGKGDFFSDVLVGADKFLTGGLGRKAFDGTRTAVNSVGKIFGKGDYVIAPQLIPEFETGQRQNIICHKEYLGDIYSSIDFAATTFNINPGLGDPSSDEDNNRGPFPWLARIAQQYEQYEIMGAVFCFEPTSSDAVVSSASTSGLGSVSIASEYNTNKPQFTNLVEMLNHQYSVSKKPSQPILHAIECEKKERPQEIQYIRSGTPTSGDLLMYDLCKTTVAVSGCQADGENLGHLWITYKVKLLKPMMPDQADDPFVLSTHYILSDLNIVTGTAYFGPTPTTLFSMPGSTFDVTLGAATITFPEDITSGNFWLRYQVRGTAAVLTTGLGATCTSNCSDLKIIAQDTLSAANIISGTTHASQYVDKWFTITGPGAVITLSGGTMPTAITSGDLIITQMNAALLSDKPMKFSNFYRPTTDAPNPPWLVEKRAEQKHRVEERHQQAATNQEGLLKLMKLFVEREESKRELSSTPSLVTGDEKESDYEYVRRTPGNKAKSLK